MVSSIVTLAGSLGTSSLLLQLSTASLVVLVTFSESLSTLALSFSGRTSVNSANVTLSLGLLGGWLPLPFILPFIAEGIAGGLTISGMTILAGLEWLWPGPASVSRTKA